MAPTPTEEIEPSVEREESLWDVVVRTLEFTDDPRRVVVVSLPRPVPVETLQRTARSLRESGMKSRIVFLNYGGDAVDFRRSDLVRLVGALLDDTAEGEPHSWDGELLPLPAGERVSEDTMAHYMSGMPKVGRRSVDLHVYDALRAEVLFLRSELKKISREG